MLYVVFLKSLVAAARLTRLGSRSLIKMLYFGMVPTNQIYATRSKCSVLVIIFAVRALQSLQNYWNKRALKFAPSQRRRVAAVNFVTV